MQARNEALERSLSESQKEKGELKDRVVELEGSLRQHRSRNSVIELKASFSKIEEMKSTIERLETTLRNCEGQGSYYGRSCGPDSGGSRSLANFGRT
ncbi:hypothetical protein Gotur_033036, partial [Gossypium turneri]